MSKITHSILQIILLSLISLYSQRGEALNLNVSGQNRHTVIYAPDGIDKPPVVFFIHGANGSGPNFENETKGNVTADREKFIAVYPSASGNGGAGIWEDMFGTTNFPFFLAILDTLEARYDIDRDRVYMTGFSQGGFISFVAACSYSEVFAAVAPVSGHAGGSCDLSRPVPVFMTFGANEGAASFVEDLDVWLDLNNCPSTPEITAPYPESNPNSRVTQVKYGPCDEGSYVVMDSVSGQGHQWPGSSNMVMADEVWEFFKDFSLKSEINIFSEKSEQGMKSFSASYNDGHILVHGIEENFKLYLANLKGEVFEFSGSANGGIDFTVDEKGLYLAVAVVGTKRFQAKLVIP